MRTRLLFLTVVVAATSAFASPARRVGSDPGYAVAPRAAWSDLDPADSVYRAARSALNDKRYADAARLFGSIVARFPRSEYAPDAYYWKAFALYRDGNLDDAQQAVEDQAKRYPQASTRSDASALMIQIKGQLAKRGDADAQRDVSNVAANSGKSCEDMDLQIAALDALQRMNSDRVVPLLQRVLARRDACSVPMRKNALFVLGQKMRGTESARTQDGLTPNGDREKILLDVARSDPDAGVRSDAVFHLSQGRSEASIDALEDLLLRGEATPVRQNALFALSQRKSDRTRKIIRTFALSADAPPSLRNDAIFYLSQNRDAQDGAWLSSAYNLIADAAAKKNIMFYMSQRSDAASLDKLISIAKTDKNTDMRKDALFYISQSKDPRAVKGHRGDRITMKKSSLVVIAAAFIVGVRAEAQSLADRMAAAHGSVGFTFPVHANICGNGSSIFISDDTSPGWTTRSQRSGSTIGHDGGGNRNVCEIAPARVYIESGGRTPSGVRVSVGGVPQRADAELGMVSATEASQFLLKLAPTLSGQSGDDAIMGAAIADTTLAWRTLLAIARDARATESSRKASLFWLSQEAGSAATAGLSEMATDDGADASMRKDALFYLSQRKGGEGVPALIRVVQESRSAKLRKDAIWYLSQSRDARALDLFAKLLAGR